MHPLASLFSGLSASLTPHLKMGNVTLSVMSQTLLPTEQVITLTEKAAAELKAMQQEKTENSGKPLRVYVEQGGCSGMQYGLVFDEQRDNDFVYECAGVNMVVDPISAEYLRGSRVDFSDALTGGGFKLQNPNAKSACGCGKSFEA